MQVDKNPLPMSWSFESPRSAPFRLPGQVVNEYPARRCFGHRSFGRLCTEVGLCESEVLVSRGWAGQWLLLVTRLSSNPSKRPG